jgi:hypothetical protein
MNFFRSILHSFAHVNWRLRRSWPPIERKAVSCWKEIYVKNPFHFFPTRVILMDINVEESTYENPDFKLSLKWMI